MMKPSEDGTGWRKVAELAESSSKIERCVREAGGGRSEEGDFGFWIFNFGLEESFARRRKGPLCLSFKIQNLAFNIARSAVGQRSEAPP